jgi:hypothetical protein
MGQSAGRVFDGRHRRVDYLCCVGFTGDSPRVHGRACSTCCCVFILLDYFTIRDTIKFSVILKTSIRIGVFSFGFHEPKIDLN